MTMKHLWCSLVLGLTVAATGSAGAQSAHERFEASVKAAVAPLGDRTVTGIKVLHLGAEHTPWLDSGFPVKAGDRVIVLLRGRVWLSRHYDISLEAPLQLWRRIGENGAISRGLDATDTFTAAESGTLQLKNLPTRWLDAKGRYEGEAPPAGPDTGGGISVALIRWAPDAESRPHSRHWPCSRLHPTGRHRPWPVCSRHLSRPTAGSTCGNWARRKSSARSAPAPTTAARSAACTRTRATTSPSCKNRPRSH